MDAIKPVGPDFHLVQLSAAGVAFANGAPLRVSNGRISVLFPVGVPVKVARFEWDMLLKQHASPDGKLLFEIAPAPAPAVEASEQDQKESQ